MTEQREATGPPIAIDRPAGQPTDLPKEGNMRIVELPQGVPRHDQPRQQKATPNSSQQKGQPVPPAPPALPEASETAESEAEPSTVSRAPYDEAGGPAPAGGIAPTRKVLAAGAGGGGIGVPLAVILTYHLELPTEIAVAYSGLLVASLSFLAGYLVPAER